MVCDCFKKNWGKLRLREVAAQGLETECPSSMDLCTHPFFFFYHCLRENWSLYNLVKLNGSQRIPTYIIDD
jgi:hypothetical protein